MDEGTLLTLQQAIWVRRLSAGDAARYGERKREMIMEEAVETPFMAKIAIIRSAISEQYMKVAAAYGALMALPIPKRSESDEYAMIIAGFFKLSCAAAELYELEEYECTSLPSTKRERDIWNDPKMREGLLDAYYLR